MYLSNLYRTGNNNYKPFCQIYIMTQIFRSLTEPIILQEPHTLRVITVAGLRFLSLLWGA